MIDFHFILIFDCHLFMIYEFMAIYCEYYTIDYISLWIFFDFMLNHSQPEHFYTIDDLKIKKNWFFNKTINWYVMSIIFPGQASDSVQL